MPLTSLYRCSRCKKEFNFDNIKYDSDNRLICVECLGKQKAIEKKEKLKLEKAEEGEAINFICVSCRFKFSVRKGSPKAVKCPYCSKHVKSLEGHVHDKHKKEKLIRKKGSIHQQREAGNKNQTNNN